MNKSTERLSNIEIEKFHSLLPIVNKSKLSNIQYYCKKQPTRDVPFFVQNYDHYYTMFLNKAFETIYYLFTPHKHRKVAILDENYIALIDRNYILIVNHTKRCFIT